MDTKFFDMTGSISKKSLFDIASILRGGGLVAIPTETVYGLAANAFDERAVSKIFTAKGRPQDNPLIVHIANYDDIYNLACSIPPCAKVLADNFWPGPLTMIFKKKSTVPGNVSAGLDTVAVRIPSHPAALAVIKECSFPLAAPSANLSGRPSPTSAKHVMDDLNGRIDAIIDGGVCDIGIESTVVDLTQDILQVLRPGRITYDDLKKVLCKTEINDCVTLNADSLERPASPGMKYTHYSPNAKVFLVKGSFSQFKDYVNDKKDSAAICFSGEENLLDIPAISLGEQNDSLKHAHNLFRSLRKTDEMNVNYVYIRHPSPHGVGFAVLNRLLKAADFEVIHL